MLLLEIKIYKLETTCFGLTLAIFKLHLEKADCKICYTIMQIGVEHSSPTCLVKYDLFYRCEKFIIIWIRCICTCGDRCVVVWCLDNPCGGSITGSFCCEKFIIIWIRCICTCGGRCVVVWCLDNPCGGSITGLILL